MNNPDDNIVIMYSIENGKEVKTIMTVEDCNSMNDEHYQQLNDDEKEAFLEEIPDEEWEAFLQRRAAEEYCY